MEGGGGSGFYDSARTGGGFSNVRRSETFPPKSPSWYAPAPQSTLSNDIVSNQCHQRFDTYKGTSISSSAFGEFSSSGSGIASSYEEAIPTLPIDQGFGDVNMFLDGGQCTMEKGSDHRNDPNPNIDFTNDVINPRNQIANNGGTNSSKSFTKRLWTAEEDSLLSRLVSEYGTKHWAMISDFMEGRSGKSCRERWSNCLRPDIKRNNWSEEEERILVAAHKKLGNKWCKIVKLIPGRTENAIKNHWNAATRKKTMQERSKRYELDSGKPKSTVLRDYVQGLSSTSTTNIPSCTTMVALRTSTNNVSVLNYAAIPQDELPSSYSSDSPSFGLVPPVNQECAFMKNILQTTMEHPGVSTSFEPLVQALEPQSQSIINPHWFNENFEYRSSPSSNHFDDSSNMYPNFNSQTDTQFSPDAYLSCTFGEPIFGYGDMNMDLPFNGLGGGFSSQ